MSGDRIDLGVVMNEGSIATKDAVVDLGKERELRSLRRENDELRTKLALRDGKATAATVMRSSTDEKHGYKCGFHPQIEVSDHVPEITCAICGEELDPYEVLRDFAHEERKFVYTLGDLQQQKKVLEHQVIALKREKNNLAAQVRKRGGKPSEISQQAEHEARWGKKG